MTINFANHASAHLSDDQKILHVLNRLSYGVRPGDIENVRAMGIQSYIQAQLSPDSIALPQSLTESLSQLATLNLTPAELRHAYGPPPTAPGQKPDRTAVKAAREKARIILQQATQARLLRAIESPQQLQEVMVDFWYNHFNVYAGKGLDELWMGAYEQEAIRPHALGRFRDLLGATAHHPAMLVYLDNWQNVAPSGSSGSTSPNQRAKQNTRRHTQGLNENYAREVMELHTLGVGGGYTQQDVITLAKIFTGWGLQPPHRPAQQSTETPTTSVALADRQQPMPYTQNLSQVNPQVNSQTNSQVSPQVNSQVSPQINPDTTANHVSDAAGSFYFNPRHHDFSNKVFLGQSIPGSGMTEGETALDILAKSPATAKHISYELAQYFVADQPPADLVDRLAQKFLQTDGDIRAVLNTLLLSDEFWQPQYFNAQFKTPYRYAISAIRATGLSVSNFKPITSFLQQQGMPLYGCLTPDGYKTTQEVWLNPDSLIRRLSFATALATGHLTSATPQARLQPLDAAQLSQTLGNLFSDKTKAAIAASNPSLQAALMLGSPEFMHY